MDRVCDRDIPGGVHSSDLLPRSLGLCRAMAPLIVCEDLWKVYRVGDVEVQALRGLSVTINEGEFVAIMGTSGSGSRR